jgi:type I restriction enzyme M protein
MPSKRQILDLLTRPELQDIADQFQLEVADRRVKDQLVDAAAGSRKVVLADVLAAFSRDRLKELCSTLGLDESGKEKAVLVERLTGQSVQPSVSASARPNGSNGKSQAPTDAPAIGAGKLSRDQLERYLWSAADILRGSIDSSDYKSYIFGLLFLKRLSDRFDEECEAVKAAGGDPEDKDEHEFFVPKRARWSQIQKAATELGTVLNTACHALEEENHSLDGVLAGIDYNDERKLGDAKQRDTVLARLVQHFASLNLRNDNLSEPDLLGRAYEYLIEKFADDAGKKGGEFYTPRKVVQLIVELLAPTEGMRICDPTCGSGGMLIECAHFVERKGRNPKNLTLHGQEKNLGTWAICKMNTLLHGLPDALIEKGDTIRDPKLVREGVLQVYDRVIANPPFSLDEWGREVAERDAYGRFHYGIPPKTKGDLAFVQHMVATLDKHGQLGVVMPHGVLFRGSSEGDIRRGFINDDIIEAVIGLPPNLFYGTGIPAAVLVMNKDKHAKRRGRVLFVDASTAYEAAPNQNLLRDEDLRKIVDTFNEWKDVPGFSAVVDTAAIERNEYNLNIGRYVEPQSAVVQSDVRGALLSLADLTRARSEAENKMRAALRGLGLDG